MAAVAARRRVAAVASAVRPVAAAAAATTASSWAEVPQAPPDPILGVTEAFRADDSPDKLNLGVGAYRTDAGAPLVLDVVKKAEAAVVADPKRNKEYLGIAGNAAFCGLSAKLAYGEDSAALAEGRVACVQALSGTGSLRVGGEFLSKHYPGPKVVYLPDPTWGNHKKIFPLSGIDVEMYPYFDPATKGLAFDLMMETLEKAPDGAVVLLHACAHNPTGVDPTPEQWAAILALCQKKGFLPFFDSAYQGFASGDLEKDAASVRMFADAGMELLLAQSYAKNMGLYGERVGALSVVCADAADKGRVESQLKQVIRPMYSNPPCHGAAIVETILSDPAMLAEWKAELKGMADRILQMRSELHAALTSKGAPGNWDHITSQIGMFSFTGLTPAQVKNMTEKWHVYMTGDGRISLAGLSSSKCDYLADAIIDSVTNH